jgi:metal-responsive CopG/Arc/MetJ family transcriptional regulator
MARRSIGETAADTVMMQVRWPGDLLRQLDAFRGDRTRADVIREAVAEKLAREAK